MNKARMRWAVQTIDAGEIRNGLNSSFRKYKGKVQLRNKSLHGMEIIKLLTFRRRDI
jgi:hypothetical protein